MSVHTLPRPLETSRVLGYSDTFEGPCGLRHAWDQVRGDILVTHGQPRDAKGFRLAAGSIILDVLHKPSGRWLGFCDTRSTMDDRLRMNKRLTKGDRALFRLRAANQPSNPAGGE